MQILWLILDWALRRASDRSRDRVMTEATVAGGIVQDVGVLGERRFCLHLHRSDTLSRSSVTQRDRARVAPREEISQSND
jgi:hypothetical protein